MFYDLPETRLCKQVYEDLVQDYLNGSKVAWPPYCSEIHTTLSNAGLDRAFRSNNESWLQPYMRLSLESYKISFFSRY